MMAGSASLQVVTSFLRDGDRFLILRRSGRVRTMKHLWSGVSGSIEPGEEPICRAKTEIREELGLADGDTVLLRVADRIVVSSSLHDKQWEIFPFLFSAASPRIRLNWENTEYRWVTLQQIARYRTVPRLVDVLYSLL